MASPLSLERYDHTMRMHPHAKAQRFMAVEERLETKEVRLAVGVCEDNIILA